MSDRRPAPVCSHCGTPLKLTQPDESDHIRLLATCPEPRCGRWFVRLDPPAGRSVLIPLERVPTLAALGVRPDPIPTEEEARASVRGLAVVPA